MTNKNGIYNVSITIITASGNCPHQSENWLPRVFCYLSEMHQGTRKETSHDHLSSIIIDMFMIGSQYGLLFF